MKDEICESLKQKLNAIMKNVYTLKGKGSGECGMLLEKLLGIESNCFSVADLNGVELKVHSVNSHHPITLFSRTFDGPDFFEIKRIVEKYGININSKYNSKILYVSLSCVNYFSFGRYLKFKLSLDNKKKKLFLIIANSNGKIIEKKAYWDYATLFSILERKLKKICFISFKTSYVGGIRFVEYTNYRFFKLKSFENFIFCLKTGKIIVNIKYGVYKQGSKAGKPYDHGIAFQISIDDLNFLFDIYM